MTTPLIPTHDTPPNKRGCSGFEIRDDTKQVTITTITWNNQYYANIQTLV